MQGFFFSVLEEGEDYWEERFGYEQKPEQAGHVG